MITSLTMHGISSTYISLLWNGNKTPGFTPVRGLRQGDPLSPYRFVLCMERLVDMINQSVRLNNWSPVTITRTGPRISHLFFVDDVLLFTKAKPSQTRLVANVLHEFCAISGFKVSLEKSQAFASKGVPTSRKNKIQEITQISFTSNLGKYLGFHIIQGRQQREDFAEVIERVDSKLASWKGKLLHKLDHLTLAKSVLSATPTYDM